MHLNAAPARLISMIMESLMMPPRRLLVSNTTSKMNSNLIWWCWCEVAQSVCASGKFEEEWPFGCGVACI